MIFGVIVFQFIVCSTFYKLLQSKAQKLAIVICNISFFLYSCLGIYLYQMTDKFYFSYLFCILAFNIFFYAGDGLCSDMFKAKKDGAMLYGSNIDYYIQNCSTYLKYVACLYFAFRIIALFYPEFYFKYLFVEPNFIYSNLLDSARDSYSSTYGHILSTLTSLTMPFAYIYLRKQGKGVIIAFFVLDLLAQYLVGRASIGRLPIIENVLVICMVFYLLAVDKKSKRKIIIVTLLACAFSFMVYTIVEYLRNGYAISIASVGLFDSVKFFIDSEFFYPSNYDLAQNLYEYSAYKPSTFWLWLLTLPIPKSIFDLSFVDSYTSIIYRVFSYYFYGHHWGYEAGYGGMLLSVLGDGIMVYGVKFAFVLVIPFAFFIGYFLRFLLKIKNSELLYCSTLFYFFVSFRPGVQYGLAQINTFVSILLIVLVFCFLCSLNKQKESPSSKYIK